MMEIVAFIRPDRMGATRDALAEAGFPGFTAKACLGRGWGMLPAVIEGVPNEILNSPVDEILLRNSRLIAKRFLMIVVNDADAERAVDIIVNANKTGNIGDGRIFVLPVAESYIVRTGESMGA
ncbi:MAG: P-II family nitrogen regulator [Candidatus Methanoplasma sp.]|jgi:nitrogen regulatory protein PII 2|nr:P-II family nitrogen regulator [Candidatus Methanoplasma sp.]